MKTWHYFTTQYTLLKTKGKKVKNLLKQFTFEILYYNINKLIPFDKHLQNVYRHNCRKNEIIYWPAVYYNININNNIYSQHKQLLLQVYFNKDIK